MAEDAAGAVLVVHVPLAGATPFEATVPCTPGLSVLGAVRASGLAACYPEIDLGRVRCGVWGKPREADALVAPGDRVEVYRPLTADPKASRSLRAKKRALK
jgi:putative ubiquitin-RnfH superfamily antitoxin RatB of RatAB toxin-antitoxin module